MNISEFIDFLKDNIDSLEDVELTPESNFNKLDEWDSVSMLSLMALISTRCGIQISPKQIAGFANVQELFNFVNAKE